MTEDDVLNFETLLNAFGTLSGQTLSFYVN